jgi:hypothetical protein
LRRAAAFDGRVAPPPTRAKVHRANELESSGKEGVPSDAGDGDDTILQRLPEGLEDGARELRKLVEEKHAAMRKGDLTRTRIGTPADHGRCRRAVMRRPEGRHDDERALRWQQSYDRVDARHLERLRPCQRRKDSRQPPSEHRLAGSGGTCEQEVVGARAGDLESAPSSFLPAHVGQVCGRICL